MPKKFDPIRETTEWRPDITLEEKARRGIRSIQLRIANPDLPKDCLRLARLELKRWRGILLRAANPQK